MQLKCLIRSRGFISLNVQLYVHGFASLQVGTKVWGLIWIRKRKVKPKTSARWKTEFQLRIKSVLFFFYSWTFWNMVSLLSTEVWLGNSSPLSKGEGCEVTVDWTQGQGHDLPIKRNWSEPKGSAWLCSDTVPPLGVTVYTRKTNRDMSCWSRRIENLTRLQFSGFVSV